MHLLAVARVRQSRALNAYTVATVTRAWMAVLNYSFSAGTSLLLHQDFRNMHEFLYTWNRATFHREKFHIPM